MTLPLVRHDLLLALDQTITRLVEQVGLEAGVPVTPAPPTDDATFYAHYPLPVPEFAAGMAACDAVFTGSPRSFVDLGCGFGGKLVIAHYLGWDATGVEINPEYVVVARRLAREAAIICADVTTFLTAFDLTAFDVVYSYRLCVDLDAQRELNALIASRMRPGALYFCAGSDPVGLEPAGLGVWRV